MSDDSTESTVQWLAASGFEDGGFELLVTAAQNIQYQQKFPGGLSRFLESAHF
jgi:hypothetical protein